MKIFLSIICLSLIINLQAQTTEEDPFMDRSESRNKTEIVSTNRNLFKFDSNGKVVFTEVVSLVDSSYNSSVLYSTFKEYFSTASDIFNRKNQDGSSGSTALLYGNLAAEPGSDFYFKNDNPLKFTDSDEKKVIGKVVYKYIGTTFGCIRLVYFNYDVILEAKDGRYKITITNFNYASYNPANNQPMGFNTLSKNGPCVSRNNLEGLLNCTNCNDGMSKMFAVLISDVQIFFSETKRFISGHPPSSKSDW